MASGSRSGAPRSCWACRVAAAAARSRGEIALNDGLVSTETLLQLDQVDLEQSGMLERVVRIKEDAFGRRVRERLLPSQEVLAQRLFRQSQELADVQRHLQRYHALVIELRERLRDMLAQLGRRRSAAAGPAAASQRRPGRGAGHRIG